MQTSKVDIAVNNTDPYLHFVFSTWMILNDITAVSDILFIYF